MDRVFFHETIRLDARSGNVNFFDFEFLIFFVVLLAIFWGLSSRPMAQQWVLLLGSALFLLSWNWTSLVVILANAAAVYWYSRWLKKNQSTLSLWIGIVAQLLVIVYFRIFINDQTTAYKANRFQLEVIIGLSFFALQNIGYLVQVWKRNIPPATRIQDYLLYNLYFPKVVVGPIVEYSDFEQSVKNSSAAIFSKNFYFSVFSIFLGLFKITVISQFIETTLSSLEMAYPDRILPGLAAWGTAIFGFFNMYCDFSGLIDIGRGVSLLFGIRMPDNFDQPYFSKSFFDYWARWHISLSNWIKKYVYFPLAVQFRSPYLGVFFAFLIGGLWHGFFLEMIAWGLLCAAILLVAQLGARFRFLENSKWFLPVRVLFVFHVYAVLHLFTLFRRTHQPFRYDFTLFSDDKILAIINDNILTVVMIVVMIVAETFSRKFKNDVSMIVLSTILAILVGVYMKTGSYVFYYMRL